MFLCCFNKGKHEIPLNNRAGKIRKETTESFKENMPGMNRQRFLNGRNLMLNENKMTDIPIWEKMNLTVKEAAEYSNIGENTLRDYIKLYMSF